MASAKKTQGLILTTPGAPNTPHIVDGVRGLYRPDVATPVSGATGLAEAKRLDADKSIPLKLVEIDDPSTAQTLYEKAISDSKNVQRRLRRGRAKGSEASRLVDETDATKGA